MEFTELNNIIKSSKNILLISHVNPDGDTLGSMCGLYSAILENFKKKWKKAVKIDFNYLSESLINEINAKNDIYQLE